MQLLNRLQNLSLLSLRRFFLYFVPVLIVMSLMHYWRQAQQYLDHHSKQQLKMARLTANPRIDQDPTTKAFLSKHSVILSLTSIPERVQYIHQIVSSIDLQHVDKVIVNLPKQCNRSKATYQIPNELVAMHKVEINWLERDFGPVSKVLPVLEICQDKPQSSMIIVMDDDVIYPRGMVNAHIHALAHHPNQVTTTMPGRLISTQARPPFSYQVSALGHHAKIKRPDSIIHGTGSYAFINDKIDLNWLTAAMKEIDDNHIVDCLLSDDLIISIAFSRNKTEPYLVANDVLAHALLKPHPLASRRNPLNQTMWSWSLDRLLTRGPLQLTQSRINRCLDQFDRYNPQ